MEKRSWRFTLRDALIIVVLLLIAYVFVNKLMVARVLDRPETTFAIVIQSEAREAYYLDQVKVGDRVYQKGSPVVFGVVTDVEAVPATLDIPNVLTGEYQTDVLAPNLYNIVITLQTDGQAALSGAPIIDNNLITLNQYLVVNTGRVYLPSRVMSIANEG